MSLEDEGERRERKLGAAVVPVLFGAAGVIAAVSAGEEVSRALAHPSSRHWLLAAYMLLRAGVILAFAYFTIGRRPPERRARNPLAYVAAAAAMGTVILFATPTAATPEILLVIGSLLVLASYLWLLASVLALGRCFGILPEARGLVTRGPYRLVRHPVYLGEIGACVGLAIAAPVAVNALALAAVIAAQLARAGFEERALRSAFPQYGRYAAVTPRIVPDLHALVRGALSRTPYPKVQGGLEKV